MPTQNVGVYPFALREFEIYQTSCCKAKAKRFLIFFLKHRKDSDYLPCLHNEAARTYENTSFISSYGSFSDGRKLYILPDFVQGNQSSVLHISDECTVGEGAFVDVRIFGVGLKEGLPDGFVDDLHGDTLYGCGGGIGG